MRIVPVCAKFSSPSSARKMWGILLRGVDSRAVNPSAPMKAREPVARCRVPKTGCSGVDRDFFTERSH